MKFSKYIIISLLFIGLLQTSCKQSYKPGKGIESLAPDKIDVPETEALLKFLSNSGDYINSKKAPSLVSAADVYENQSKYLCIDIRSEGEYVNGHINGAVNKGMHELMIYLDEKVAVSIYDKIVIVCTNGQSSAYASSVLRLMGYSNVFSMTYGMSSWNKKLDKWSSKVSSKYISKLETKTNPVEGMHAYPQLNTGETCGAEILQARGRTLLNTPFKKLKMSADRAFKNPDDFYIINLWPKDRYDIGHVPGAYQYTPRKDISAETLLNTIPFEKKILVYGYTGQSSAFMVAYLRLLGYNAFTMPFGANSFMHSTLKLNNWNAFKASEIFNDFPLIKGENPTDKAFEKEINKPVKKNRTASKPTIRRKKKEVEGGCS